MKILKFNPARIKRVATLLLLTMLIQIFTPAVSFALTSGPSQPEFSSFEPVATTNMVDLFTGDFTYNVPVLNVPGPNGSGYALSLSYHSGENMETEGSWVGYGWTLNSGAINRNKRGFADDWKGENVTFHNKAKASTTVFAGASQSAQVFSVTGLGANGQIRKNNYNGVGYSIGVNLGLFDGMTSLGYNITDGDGSFSLRVNPGAILSNLSKNKRLKSEKKLDELEENGETQSAIWNQVDKISGQRSRKRLESNFGQIGIFDPNTIEYPSTFSAYNGAFATFSVASTLDPCLPIGNQQAINGGFSIQKNVSSTVNEVNGFMHSHDVDMTEEGTEMMDFYVDKETDYTKKNRFLGMPVVNADVFSMSGEGISGGFKAQYQDMLHLRPNKVVSNSIQTSVNIDIHLVSTGINAGFGYGGTFGAGYHRLVKQAWPKANNPQASNLGFRFTNDLGGNLSYTQGLAAQKVGLTPVNSIPGLKKYEPDYSSVSQTYTGTENSSSQFLGFNTYNNININSGSVNPYAYEKGLGDGINVPGLSDFIDYNDPSINNLIGEFSVTKDDGLMYNYGLGVFSKNEKSLSTSVLDEPGTNLHNGQIYQDSYDNIGNPNSSLETILGQEENAAYATTYLLTSICTPDYLDRNYDGPTDDDFGGWTKFNYTQVHGSMDKNANSGDWYKWRVPYNGFNYQRNELSRPGDDLASHTEGEKEIYYLESIETKTHIAIFETEDRLDAIEAASSSSALDSDEDAKGIKKLKSLKKVKLFLKTEYLDDPSGATPLQVVNFDYNYELCKGVPNHTNSASTADNGKLTLSKMWVDYEGIYDAKLSPYEFHYDYPDPATYPAKYQSTGIDDVTDGINSNTENPNYNYFNTDAWGNYQINGTSRFDNMQNWVDQKQTEIEFDPGAWQLKRITLPSGGEIHVQYEQDQYSYVQDQKACAMINFASANDARNNNNLFTISALEANVAPGDMLEYSKYLQSYFNNNRVYFKFLYNLSDGALPEVDHCDAEYIAGYAKVYQVTLNTSNELEFVLGAGPGIDRYDTPKDMCIDFWQHNRRGVTLNRTCDHNVTLENFTTVNSGVLEVNVDAVIDEATALVTSSVPIISLQCSNMNPNLSYLRLPVWKSKRGGGIRVKRLMMFDDGVGLTSESELYGSEYIYENEDGSSTGVATNEPSSIREENALIQYLSPETLGTWDELKDKLVGGRDRYQYEGAIGEGMLPGASVGYSKVIVRNIHSGKTNTGFTINEFYTAFDQPFKASQTSIASERDYLPLPLPLYSSFTNNLWLSQGYHIDIYNMHGRMRKTASYSGDYDNIYDPTAINLVSSSESFYYGPNELVPVLNDLEDVQMVNLGQETEIYDYNKRVHDKLYSGSGSFDASLCLTPVGAPLVFGSFFPQVSISETDLYNHITVKTTNHPVIMKGTRTFTDGIYHTTENLAFDPKNGRSIVSKSYDGYNDFSTPSPADIDVDGTNHKGTYVNYRLPAWWYYDNMDHKSKNERFKTTFVAASNSSGISANFNSLDNELVLTAKGSSTGTEFCDLMSNFSTGDLIRINELGSVFPGYFHIAAVNGTTLVVQPTTFNTLGVGLPIDINYLEIVRSGNTNQTTADVGSFTTYAGNLINNVLPDITTTPANTTAMDGFLATLNAVALTGGQITPPANLLGDVYGTDECLSPSRSIDISSDVNGVTIAIGGERCISSVNGNPANNVFFADYETGDIYYGDPAGCYNQLVNCLSFCNTAHQTQSLDKVVAASAITLSDLWGYDETSYNKESYGSVTRTDNEFELGKRGKWRLESMFAYKTDAVGIGSKIDVSLEGTNDDRANYNAGTFILDLFRFKNPTSNDPNKWLKSSTITQYSPNGNALEEVNILGVKSAVKFGYNKSVPYLIANNSDNESVLFESFENTYGTSGQFVEDGVQITSGTNTDFAHAGKYSLEVPGGGAPYFTSNDVNVNTQIAENGMLFKVWVKGLDRLSPQVEEPSLILLANNSTIPDHNFKWVAQTGEWSLYEVFVTPADLAGYLGHDLSFTFGHTGSTSIYVDDIRMQPNDAELSAHVYDTKTLRLLTTFDSEHFGMYYQYNLEGQLVRKIVETEKGFKTVSETQYNTVKKDRSGL